MCRSGGAPNDGTGRSERTLFYNISLETFVPEDHPLRAIRPFMWEAPGCPDPIADAKAAGRSQARVASSIRAVDGQDNA